jgi:outer membrane protein
MKSNRILVLLLAGFGVQLSFAQPADSLMSNKLSLSLKNVVALAIQQSASVKYAQNTNVNYYWRWKNFKTSFRPQLTLKGNLPYYYQTNEEITQDDGSTRFVQVSKLKTLAQLSLSQSIPVTGTYVWASTSIYRLQDYYNKTVGFSGSPYDIGFYQPILAFNYMKWQRKTEPLVYEEAQKDFVQSVEEIALYATQKFFKFLQIQTNYNLAENNLKNSQNNLLIAKTKKELGKISDNDYSRIQLSVLNAQKALNKSRMELKNAAFELKSYLNLDQTQDIELSIPLDMVLFEINPETALEQAKLNRKETPYFKRRLIEADRDLVKAKRSTGVSGAMTVSYGLSNSADSYMGVYRNPEEGKSVNMELSVPILDWGRSASSVKLAESKRDLVLYEVEKDQSDFEREIAVQVEQFGLLKDQLNTAREADKVAENGYQIALKKFQSGEISITDLNISLSERETAKRDYITSIENYWESYYNLRILTLYDFELNQTIRYENPMLSNQ